MTALIPTSGSSRDALMQAVADLDAAEAAGQAGPIAVALARLGRCYRVVGEVEAATVAFEQSLRWCRAMDAVDLAVDLLCDLCELGVAEAAELDAEDPDGHLGEAARECARELAEEAALLAARATDVHWEAHALLRISELLERCGHGDEARKLQLRAFRLVTLDSGATDHLTTMPAVLA